jgi:hypothetical protein
MSSAVESQDICRFQLHWFRTGIETYPRETKKFLKIKIFPKKN